MNGIDNWFILNNIFGNNFSLIGTWIDNIRSTPLDGRLTIDFITENEVINPSPRWKKWDKIYITLDVFGVCEIHTKITDENFIVTDFSIKQCNERYILDIYGKNNSFIKAEFAAGGLIQNVKPIITDSDF